MGILFVFVANASIYFTHVVDLAEFDAAFVLPFHDLRAAKK